jgi:uncharacterized membrane protein
MPFRETHLRTFIKTILYRISTSLITILIIFVITRHAVVSLGAGAVESVTKLIFYYGYERFWNVVHWGKYPHNHPIKRKRKRKK